MSVYMYSMSCHVCEWEAGWRWLQGGSYDLVLSSSLPERKERGNDPTQTGSAARWPVAVHGEVGIVCYMGVCVCVWVSEALVCVGLPLVLLHHCFNSLGQETAVESEVKVCCTQPFEGYSALLASINQIAWSWAFTELEKPHHVSTFTQTQAPGHRHSCWIIRGHPNECECHDPVVDSQQIFSLISKIKRVDLCAF